MPGGYCAKPAEHHRSSRLLHHFKALLARRPAWQNLNCIHLHHDNFNYRQVKIKCRRRAGCFVTGTGRTFAPTVTAVWLSIRVESCTLYTEFCIPGPRRTSCRVLARLNPGGSKFPHQAVNPLGGLGRALRANTPIHQSRYHLWLADTQMVRSAQGLLLARHEHCLTAVHRSIATHPFCFEA